ncbi:MAG: GAF domain-containing protein [Anaerolineae bacterium]|nr:GAF domain-containing protein [Anaerolineae bacterium]
MSIRQQNNHLPPDEGGIRRLSQTIGQATHREMRLQPFLDGLLEQLTKQFVSITRVDVYLRGDDGTYERWAGHGIPPDTAITPLPASAAALALEQHEPVLPVTEAKTNQWAVPLLCGDKPIGVLQVELPPDAAQLQPLRLALLTLAPTLALAVEHLQATPLTRALALGPHLAADHTPQTIVNLVAGYLGDRFSRVELAYYDFKNDGLARIRSFVRTAHEPDKVTERVLAASDYPFHAVIPQLRQNQPVHIHAPRLSSLVTPEKLEKYDRRFPDWLALLPIQTGGDLIGTLMVGGERLAPGELAGLQALATQIAMLHQNRTLSAEVHQLHNMGQALADMTSLPTWLKTVYEHIDPAPHDLFIEAVQFDSADQPVSLSTEVSVSAQGTSDTSPNTGLAFEDFHVHWQTLATGAPVLVNDLKTASIMSETVREHFIQQQIRALAMFPVMAGGKITHVLMTAYTDPHIFSAMEIRLLHRLSNYISLGLQHSALQAQTTKQTEQLARRAGLLEAVYETARQVSANLVGGDVLQTTCQRLSHILKLDYAAIIRFDQVPANGNLVAEQPLRSQANALIPLKSFGVYKHFQTYRAPLIIDDVAAAETLLGPSRERFQALQLKSMVLAPLLLHDDLIGTLVLGAADGVQAFDAEDKNTVQAIAVQIATGLRNAALFTEIQRRANQLERIGTFGRLVTSTFDRTEIIWRVSDVISNLLPSDQVCLALTFPQTGAGSAGQIRVYELNGISEPAETIQPVAGSSVEEVVQTQMPILVPDLRSSTYNDHRQLVEKGLNAVLVVPLIAGGRAIGALSIAHKRARIYTPTDLTLLQQIGNQIAIALENARQFDLAHQRAQYEESLSQITSQLQQQSDLHDLLEHTMQDLGHVLGANRARVRLKSPSKSNNNGAHASESVKE